MFLVAVLTLMVGEPPRVPPGKIAFMRQGKVCIIDAVGAGELALTAELRYQADRPLAWSPQGARLLFWSHSEVGWDICVMDADGQNQKNLTNTRSGGCRSAAWSPDGKRIAFMRDEPAGLYIMDADGNNQKRLSEKGHRDAPPSWSPDGRRITFADLKEGFAIYVLDADGRHEARIVQGAQDPRWSPNGKKILCTARRHDSYCLLLVDPDGKNEVILTKGLSPGAAPLWSPDGSQIAYVSTKKGKDQLRVIDANGKNELPLAELGPEDWRSPTCPSWPRGARFIRPGSRPDRVCLRSFRIGLGQFTAPVHPVQNRMFDGGGPECIAERPGCGSGFQITQST
jgi:Tol biopolymer transport system component